MSDSTALKSDIGMLGGYELLSKVAVGSMAEVFLARERLASGKTRSVAIKQILPHVANEPDLMKVIRAEASRAKQLRHPNVGEIYEFGIAKQGYFLAVEWVEGASFEKIVQRAQRFGGLPVPVAVRVIADAAAALDYAHHAVDRSGQPLGMVHRDVSPANILVSYRGEVKLVDFGIARARDVKMTMDVTAAAKRKLAFLSPEQCLGEAVDARSDIFALGVCLFEALCGKSLYRRKSEFEAMRAIIEEPPPSIRKVRPELPPALEAIVSKALQKDPSQRFARASEFADALEILLLDQEESISPDRVGEIVRGFFDDDKREPSERTEIETVALDSSPDRTPAHAAVPVVAAPREIHTSRWWYVAALLTVMLGVAVAAWLLNEPVPVASREIQPELGPSAEREPEPSAEEQPPELAFPEEDVEEIPEPTTSEIEVPVPQPPVVMVAPPISDPPSPPNVRVQPPVADPQVAATDPLPPPVAVRDAGTAPGGVGHLSINTRPWSRVLVNGRPAGSTPVGRVEVPAGVVELTLIDRDGGEYHRTVRVDAGEHLRVFYDFVGTETPAATPPSTQAPPANPFE